MNIKKLFTAISASAAICLSTAVCTAYAEDGVPTDDEIVEHVVAEEVPITDGIRRGEGFYECVVVYHDGIDSVYDEGGNAYSLIGSMSGKLKEGETRESVEQEALEEVRFTFSEAGRDPDDYDFDAYVYLYDDYDLSPQEFLDFAAEDSMSRGSKSESVSVNPPTGTKTAVPFAASALLAACAALAEARKAKGR